MSFFLTEFELYKAFVRLGAYLDEQPVTDTTLIPTLTVTTTNGTDVTEEKGKEKVYVDSGAANRTINLPSAAGLTKYSPRIVNLDTNNVDVVPDGSDTINGGGTVTLVSQWSTLILRPNNDGTGWIAENRLTP